MKSVSFSLRSRSLGEVLESEPKRIAPEVEAKRMKSVSFSLGSRSLGEVLESEPKRMEIELKRDEEEGKDVAAPRNIVVETVEEEEEMKEKKGDMFSPEMDPPFPEERKAEQKEEWERLARELRERKVTKSDDAAVPEYLWEEHLLSDGPTPWNISEADRPKLRRGMMLLRERMLRWVVEKEDHNFFPRVDT
jgi:hypothetical protein